MNKKGVVMLNEELTEDWANTLGECGINSLGLHSLYWHGGLDAHLNWLLDEDTQRLIEDCEKKGFTVEHQLHAVDWLLPRSQFSQNPEWFRMNEEGIRTNDWNFCVSNEEALRFISNSAYKLALLLRQSSHEYYIWMDDKENSFCHCPKCRGYSGADQNMIVMKAVLKGLKRYDSKAKLCFLSYVDSLSVPTIAPDKDMFLEFAPIGRNHAVPLDGNDEANIKNRKVLESMLKIFPPENTEILEYFLDVSLFCKWKRENAKELILDEARIRRDLAYYKRLGVSGVTTFTVYMDEKWRKEYGDGAIRLYGQLLGEYFD